MRQRKLTEDAFAYFVALGAGRRYEDVARHFKVSRRTVVSTAKLEKWGERLAKIDREAQINADIKLQETVEGMRLRHSKMLRAMASRAAKAIQEYPLDSGMEGMRAAEMVIKLERLLSGQATDRKAVNIEEIVRREYQTLMLDEEKDDRVDAERVGGEVHGEEAQ